MGLSILVMNFIKTPTFLFYNRVINGKQKRGASLNEIKLIIQCQKGEKEAFI